MAYSTETKNLSWRRLSAMLVLMHAAGGCGGNEASTSAGGSSNTGGAGGAGGSGGAGASGGAAGTSGGVGGNGGTAGGGIVDSGGADRGGTTDAGGTIGDGSTSGRFSFFVTSLNAIRRLSGSQDGFGGDLTYGETGEGAGLRGADKICTEIAESSMPGSGSKGWHAFLSAPTGGANGGAVNAIDRIGEGPWYDRQGRLFASSKANLNGYRPLDADPAIKNDFPNETGTPNHNPDLTGQVDNHDTLTGSKADGTLYTGTTNPTCSGWTSKVGSAGKPRVGHAWPRSATPMGGCAGANGCYGHWASSLDEAGCAPGVFIVEMGGPKGDTVGGGGGYGGFYCFALTP